MTATPDTAPKPKRYVPTPCGGKRMSRLGYTQLWLLVHQSGPCLSADLAPRAGLGAQSCREVLWAMVHAGTLDVVSWQKQRRGLHVPRFAVGSGQIAPYPAYLGMRQRAGYTQRNEIGIEMQRFAGMLAALRDGAMLQEIADRTGGSSSRVSDCLHLLHDARAIFVATWDRPSGVGQWLPVYELGSLPDAPRPRALTKAQIQARFREAQRSRRLHRAVFGGLGAQA